MTIDEMIAEIEEDSARGQSQQNYYMWNPARRRREFTPMRRYWEREDELPTLPGTIIPPREAAHWGAVD